LRLLPFIFVIWVVNWIDRVNVAFANLRMSADLGFSDRVYGLAVGLFAIGYVLLEIPGAVLVERWSARKWIARIMISWGLITILTGFVCTASQLYASRFALGLAEASLLPGLITYLTHWFRAEDRARAISCLYAGGPIATMIGAPVAGLLLGVRWWGLAGWRWLFILEGFPAILPTFIKRLSGLPNKTVTSLVMLPAIAGLIGLCLNAWHSDRRNERRWHAGIPFGLCGVSYLLVILTHHDFSLTMAAFVGFGLLASAGYPAFWSLPSMILSETAAAATFGLINSVGQLGGFVGPYAVGYFNDRTYSLTTGFACIGGSYLIAGTVVLLLRIEMPAKSAAKAPVLGAKSASVLSVGDP
jgi:MFS transporter, ACS family, tartrate transporter